jgi:hypothetical protein
MVIYLERSTLPTASEIWTAALTMPLTARAFEEDFGHSFSGHDGLDEHFKQMTHYAWYASRLRTSHKNDLAAMALEAARPLYFHLWNPYPEGHKRRVDFDAKRACSC